MARKVTVSQNISDALTALADRIRFLELRQNRIGNWQLTEDRTTGNLVAVRNNGQNVAKTVVVLATKAGGCCS